MVLAENVPRSEQCVPRAYMASALLHKCPSNIPGDEYTYATKLVKCFRSDFILRGRTLSAEHVITFILRIVKTVILGIGT
jgi:hypothetical protein